MKYEQSYPVHSTAAAAQRHVFIEISFVMTENIKFSTNNDDVSKLLRLFQCLHTRT